MKVRLENLTKYYPGRKNKKEIVRALDGVDFEIGDGKLVALLGPSGCGKSTTLNLISGLEKPTSGKIYFGEKDVTDLPPEKREIGMVFQNYALYPHLTVLQNIVFPLENFKGKERLPREEIIRRANDAAKLVQIENLTERRPSELSGGQQQRVAIARAIVKKPKVLLLDEPLSNLDARLRLQTREEIRRIQTETGITTVFVTHDQEEAMSISDSIVLMQNGKIRQIGLPQEVYDDPHNLFVAMFLGNPAVNLFTGSVKEGKLFLGGENVLECPGVADLPSVTVAIRPEGFIPSLDGKMVCEKKTIETTGRDTGIVFSHPAGNSPSLRALLDSGNKPAEDAQGRLRFALRKNKVYLFSPETGERIRF